MNNLTTFYIVRHGETDWNKKQVMQGQTDIPLNKEGEKQAKKLGEVLKNISFDLAFSSDLLRAKRTAELITLEKKLQIETTKLLRERNFGKFESGPVKAFHDYLGTLKDLTDKERRKYKFTHGIESDEEVTTRLITFLRETAITHPGKTILVATHGGILRLILLHTGYHTYKDDDKTAILNAAYIKLETDGVDFYIKEVRGIVPRENIPQGH